MVHHIEDDSEFLNHLFKTRVIIQKFIRTGPRKCGPYLYEKFIGIGNSFITKRYILMSRRGQDLWDGRI